MFSLALLTYFTLPNSLELSKYSLTLTVTLLQLGLSTSNYLLEAHLDITCTEPTAVLPLPLPLPGVSLTSLGDDLQYLVPL